MASSPWTSIPGTSTPAVYSAAGNRFAVLDALVGGTPAADTSARLAVEWCRRLELDGLLVAAPGRGSPARMEVYNRDGSRAEACGNGLRCLARFVRERTAGPDEFTIETDAGPRRVTCRLHAGEVVSVRTEMGRPRLVELQAVVQAPEGPLEAALVDMGNPHCILWVPDVESAPVESMGSLLQCDPRFASGVNVSFVEVRGGAWENGAPGATSGHADRQPPGGWGVAVGGPPDLLVRTWERGVGETAACGTGISAAAAAALQLGRVRSPVRVQMRGGELSVDWDGVGMLFLDGPVERLHGARIG